VIRRFPIMLLGIGLAGLGLVWVMGAAPVRDGELTGLLRERLALAQEGLAIERKMVEMGRPSESVMVWEKRVVDSRLLLSKTEAERIDILSGHMKVCEDHAAMIGRKVEAGMTSQADLVCARYSVAEARYLLAEAKLKESGGGR
jgi:hypothetical protein